TGGASQRLGRGKPKAPLRRVGLFCVALRHDASGSEGDPQRPQPQTGHPACTAATTQGNPAPRAETQTKRTFRRGSSPVISVLTESTETTETTETTGRDQGKCKPPPRGGRTKTQALCVRIPTAVPIPFARFARLSWREAL